jgi:hypothetical protein
LLTVRIKERQFQVEHWLQNKSIMPQDDKATAGVLKEYIGTRRDNPDASTGQLLNTFPEINALAQQKGVKPDVVMSELDNYYSNFKSNKFGSLDGLNQNSPFFFGESQKPAPTSTEEITPTTGDAQQAIPEIGGAVQPDKTVKGMTSDILKEYLGTRRDNPTASDSQLLNTFPEIDAYAQLKGLKAKDVLKQLDNYNSDFQKVGVEGLDDLNSKYGFDEGLKKKGDVQQAPIQEDPQQEALQEVESLDSAGSTLDSDQLELEQLQTEILNVDNPENNIASAGFNLKDENGRPMIKGSLSASLAEDMAKTNPLDFAKTYGEWDTQTFGMLKDVQSKQENDFNERMKAIDNRLLNIFRTELDIDENDNINRLPEENALVNDVVYGADAKIPEYVTPENYPKLFDNEGNLKKGMLDRYQSIQRQEGNSYLRGLASENKKNFIKSLDLPAGDERNSAYNEKVEQISMNYLSEDDLKIKKLQNEVEELKKMPAPGRTTDYFIELKKKQNELKSVKNNRGLYDPDTGEFISGNKDMSTKTKARTERFNNTIDQFQAQYEKTDLGKLQKKRDELYFRYKAFTEDFMLPNWDTAFTPGMEVKYVDSEGNQFASIDQGPGDKDLKAIVTYEDTENPGETKEYEVDLTTQRQRLKFVGGKDPNTSANDKWNDSMKERQDNLLAEYMAVNRIISLNLDPGQIEDVSIDGAVLEGVSKALGSTPKTESALADMAINSLSEMGVSTTAEQKDKLSKNFGQIAGQAVGSSLPASLEIGFNVMLGNKALGIAKLGKTIEVLSRGNKVAKFMMEMVAESAVQSAAFSSSDESGTAGAGEGIGQFLAGAALSRFGVKNRILNFGARLLAGGVTETVAEFSGQFVDEMANNGLSMEEASEKTFGKTPDELIEKVALTYVTALSLGVFGAGQDSRSFINEFYSEIENSDSQSPIVQYAKEFDVTTAPTEAELLKMETLDKKMKATGEITEEEMAFAQVIALKEDYAASEGVETNEGSAPIVSKNGGKTEYKFTQDGEEKFFFKGELEESLNDEEFVEGVKAGEIELELNNPSPEVEAIIEEKFPSNNPEADINIEEVGAQEGPASTEVQETGVLEENTKEVEAGVTGPPIEGEVKTEVNETNTAEYEAAPENIGDKLDEIKQKGSSLDNDVSGNVSGIEIVSTGEREGRLVTEVKYPDGTTQLFYKSSAGTSGKQKGGWFPIGGFLNEKTGQYPKGWFIKDSGVKNLYGSQTFQGTADFLTANENELFGLEKETTTEAAASESLKTESPAAEVAPKKKVDPSIGVPINTGVQSNKAGDKLSTNDKKKIKKVNPASPRQAIMQSFLAGMKLDRETAVRETGFGRKDNEGKISGKSEIGKRKNFIGEGGMGIDQAIQLVRESSPEVFEGMDDQAVRDEIINVLTDYTTRNEIGLDLRDEFTHDGIIYFNQNDKLAAEESAAIEEEFTEREREYNEAVSDEEFNALTDEQVQQTAADFEEYIKSKTYGEIEQEFGTISKTEAAKPDTETESKVADGETEVESEQQQKIKEASKKISDAILGAKFKIDATKFQSNPVGPLFKAAVNTALEAAALVVRTGGTVSQAVVNGLNAFRESDYYKGLSEEGQLGIEDAVALEIERIVNEASTEEKVKPEPKKTDAKAAPGSFLESLRENRKQKQSEGRRTSRVALRNAETMADGAEKQAKIDKAQYKVFDFETAAAKIDALYDQLGYEGAVEYVNDPKNNVDEALKQNLKLDAAASMIEEGRITGDPEMIERGEKLLLDVSFEKTKAGQAIAFTQEIYNRHPELFWRKKLDTHVNAKKKEALDAGYGDGQTVQDAINDVRSDLQQEITGLKEQISTLTEELKKATDEKKKTATRTDSIQQQKKRGEKQVAEGKAKLRKFLKKGGGTANAGLDPLLIEAIGDMISGYLKQGISNTRLIVSKVHGIVTKSGVSLSSKNIRNIAESMDEFNSAKRQEQVAKFYENIKGLLGSKRKVDASTINDMVENPNEIWEQYQKNIISKIKSRINQIAKNKNLTPKEKANLEKLSEQITKEVNAKVRQISNSVSKKKSEKTPAKNVLADLVSNSDKIMELYNTILSDPKVSQKVKNSIEGIIQEEVVFSDLLVKNLINEELVTDQRSMNDIIATHYEGKDSMIGDLSEKLVEGLGLNVAEAKYVSDFIKERMSSIVEEKTKKALERFLAKGIKSADIQAAIDSGNITPEIQKEIDRRIKTKENSKLISKVVKAVNMGALKGHAFTNAFADKFGFSDISSRDLAKFNTLVSEIEFLRSPEQSSKEINGKKVNTFQRERVLTLEKELNTLIDTLSPKNFAYVAENYVAAKYTVILSGISTQVNANVGAAMTLAPNVLGFGLRNMASARGLIMGMLNGFKAFRAASSRATLARKRGVVEVGQTTGGYESGQAKQEDIGRFSGKRGGVERQMLNGFEKAMQNLSDKKYGKAVANALITTLMQPLRMYHLLGASDAFMSSAISQFVLTVNVYNNMAEEMGMNALQTFTGVGKAKSGVVSDLSLAERVQEALGQNAESKATFSAIANEEYNRIEDQEREKLRKQGYTGTSLDVRTKRAVRKVIGGVKAFRDPKRAYKARRIQELKENQNFEKFQYATGMVKDWLLIGTPDGIMGKLSKGASGALAIDRYKDSPLKAGRKAVAGTIFMFPRLMANSFNHIKTGIPIIGILDSFLGYGVDPATGEFKDKGKSFSEHMSNFFTSKYRADKQRVYQRLMVSTMSTVAASALFQAMFEWDDDEDDWVLKEDRPVDILGAGNFRQSKNLQAIEDFQKFSFSISQDEDGKFEEYTKTNLSPYAQGITAFLSAFSDDIKGLGDKNSIKEREGSTGDRIFKGITSNPFQSWWEGSFNSMGRLMKTAQREEGPGEGLVAVGQQIFLDNTKAIFQPAIYRDITRSIEKSQGKQQKQGDTFTEKFISGLYGMDYMLDDRKDMFGNTYPVTDNWDKWVTGVEKMSERSKEVSLLYKFDEGLNVNKWRASGFKKFGETSLITGAPKFVSTTDENQEKIIDRQQDIYKQMVKSAYKELDAIENRDDLEKAMNKIQSLSKKQAKAELIPEFIKEGTMVLNVK